MVVHNFTNEDGDIVEIQANVPVLGVLALSSFIDTTGEVGSEQYIKEFRWRSGSDPFSAWLEINNSNVSTVNVNQETLSLQIRYEREGSLGDIEINSLNFLGTYTSQQANIAFESSVFAKHFQSNDPCSINWSLNVLDKIRKNKSLLPKFIARTRDDDDQDQDFLALWLSICVFYSYIVCFARLFESIFDNIDFLENLLNQRDFLFCSIDKTLLEIQQLSQQKEQHFSERGTNTVESQIRDYLCLSEVCDLWIYRYLPRYDTGWWVGRTSPIYDEVRSIEIGYEKYLGEFVDIVNYPLINVGGVWSIVDGVLEAAGNSTAVSGLGGIDFANYGICVDENLDYLIDLSFQSNTEIDFKLKCFDSQGVELQALQIDDTVNDTFVQGTVSNRFHRYLFQIYNSNQTVSDISNDSVRGCELSSRALKMPPGTKYVIPQLLFSINSSIEATISEYKVSPLRYPFNSRYLSVRGKILLWFVNKLNLTEAQSERLFEKVFPYNVIIQNEQTTI